MILEGREGLFVATVDGEFAGYGLLKNRPWRPWTSGDSFAVVNKYRNIGVGKAILLEAFGRTNRPFLRIFVRPTNKIAIDLYKKFGFLRTGRRHQNYPDGEDALVMMRFCMFSNSPRP